MSVINFSYIQMISKTTVGINIEGMKIDMKVFKEAFIHHTKNQKYNYERLEYLGDALFHLVVSTYLYQRYEDQNSGFLTKLRICLEKGDSLSSLAKAIRLDEYIQVDSSVLNDKIIEDIFESFIGAFYVNFDFNHSEKMIIRLIEEYKDFSSMIYNDDNYKSILLEYYHKRGWGHPVYEKNGKQTDMYIISIKDPEGKVIGTGSTSVKKDAEQLASKNALIHLGVIINGEIDIDWEKKIDKETKEKKSTAKPLPIYNKSNVLITSENIRGILESNGVKIGTKKINVKLFQESMTHVSYVVRERLTEEDMELKKTCVPLQKKSNERLSFVGVSVIHFVYGEYLYKSYPNKNEGFLSQVRCRMENKESMFDISKKLGIDKYMLISTNIEIIHQRNNVNIIGQGFESFVASIYFNFGINVAREFLLSLIKNKFDMTNIIDEDTNYKKLMSSHFTNKKMDAPEFRLLKEQGMDHQKIFMYGVYQNGKLIGKGKGNTKKKAQQNAAKEAYENII